MFSVGDRVKYIGKGFPFSKDNIGTVVEQWGDPYDNNIAVRFDLFEKYLDNEDRLDYHHVNPYDLVLYIPEKPDWII